MRSLIRLGTVAAALLAWLLATAGAATAHAQLLATSPAPDQHLARPPAEVTLRFDEPVHPVRGAVRLLDSAGRTVPGTGAATTSGAPRGEVRLPLPAKLPDGGYLVTWRVVSADSHPVAGSFGFTVGAATSAAAPVADRPQDGTVVAAFWGVRTLGYAALALFAGGLLFVLFCWPPGVADRRVNRLLAAGWLAGVVAAAGALLLEGLYVANRPLAYLLDVSLLRDTVGDGFGQIGVARLVLYALAWPLWRWLRARPPGAGGRWPVFGVVATVAGLCATWAGTGHAREGSGPVAAAAVAADTTHLVAMSAWLGGLAMLLACLLVTRDGGSAAAAAKVVPRFSRLAAAAVTVLVLTGAYQAWHTLGGELTSGSSYLQLLVYKVAAFGLLVCLAAASRSAVRRRGSLAGATEPQASRRSARRLRRDEHRGDRAALAILRRSVLLELGIAAVVLGVTAALVSTSPSGHHDAAPAALAYGGPFTTTLKLADGGQVVIWIDPGRVGQNEIVADVRDAAGASRDVPEVRAQLSQPDIGAEPMTVTFRRVGPGQFVASGVQLPVTGRWRVDITVRTTDVDESSVSTNVTLS